MKKKMNYVDQYITNLKEMRADYEAKGETYSVETVNRLIAKWEQKRELRRERANE